MPYFKWTGVTIDGSLKHGKSPGYSLQELDARLFKQGISLLRCKKTANLWSSSINSFVKANICIRIAQLLQAGIMLPDALIFSAQQSSHPLLYDSLFTYAIEIQQGQSFIDVLHHKKLFDSISLTMLKAGYESGDLINAFTNVSRYYCGQYEFYKKIRASLMIPFLTFAFFVVIALFIFIMIIPRFADMFASLQHQLPIVTLSMLSISTFVRSVDMLICVAGLIGIGLLVRLWCKKNVGKCSSVVMRDLPFFGKILFLHHLGELLNALSLLISSGVSLSNALQTVIDSIVTIRMKHCFSFLHNHIQEGKLLSEAMIDSGLFLSEVVAVTRVGEESGSLGTALEYCSFLYKDMVQQSVNRFIFFLQPCMVLLLGLLITALIFSVYLPIMEMSRVI